MDLYCCYFMYLSDRSIFINSPTVNLSVSCSLFMNITGNNEDDNGGGAIFYNSTQNLVLYQNTFIYCKINSSTAAGGQSFRVRQSITKKIVGNSIDQCGSDQSTLQFINVFVCDYQTVYFQDSNITNNVLTEVCCGHINANGYMAYSNFVGNNATKQIGLRIYNPIVISRVNLIENNISSRGLVQYRKKTYLQDSIVVNNTASCYFEKLATELLYICNCTIDQNDTCQEFVITNQKSKLNTIIIEHTIQCMTLNYRNTYHINILYITPFIIL